MYSYHASCIIIYIYIYIYHTLCIRASNKVKLRRAISRHPTFVIDATSAAVRGRSPTPIAAACTMISSATAAGRFCVANGCPALRAGAGRSASNFASKFASAARNLLPSRQLSAGSRKRQRQWHRQRHRQRQEVKQEAGQDVAAEELRALRRETEELLRSSPAQSHAAPPPTLRLLHRWADRHAARRSALRRRRFSDPCDAARLDVIEAAGFAHRLLRRLHGEGGEGRYPSLSPSPSPAFSASTSSASAPSAEAGGGTVDERVGPYRLAMGLWGSTPTAHSGDRAAAILELWGSRYGGDLACAPSTADFDAVLEAYAMSACVETVDDDDDIAAAEDEVDNKDENVAASVYPDDQALSTLRLLQRMGDMHLIPALTTQSHVAHAVRRAALTPRGKQDGRNDERARTVLELVRAMDEEWRGRGATEDGPAGGGRNELVCYVRATCDALSMASFCLPPEEAEGETRRLLRRLDEIRDCASRDGGDGLDEATVTMVDRALLWAIRAWEGRAIEAAASSGGDSLGGNERRPLRRPADRLADISLAAGAADAILETLRDWGHVVEKRHYGPVTHACCLAAHPSIVHSADVDVLMDVVPLLERAEELLRQMGDRYPPLDVGQCNHVLSGWYSLSGVVADVGQATVAATTAPTLPADRADRLLRYMFQRDSEGNLLVHPRPERSTRAYNYVLQAWAKSRTGTHGAQRARSLFDCMQGGMGSSDDGGKYRLDAVARPDEITYGAVLRALRYSRRSKDAMYADELCKEMIAKYDAGEEGSVRPTARHFAAAIAALSESRQDRDRAAQKTQQLLDILLSRYRESGGDPKLMPDRHIFSDVITALARSRKGSRNAEKVLGLLDSLKELHAETEADALQPNAVVYGAALHALSAMKGDQQAIDKMEEMMNEMRENSIEPNNVCYNSLISAYAATGRGFKVEEILRAMEERYMETGEEALKPNVVVYTNAINAWSRTRSPDAVKRARTLLDEMIEQYSNGDENMKPNSHTFTSMINVLWRSGGDDAAKNAETILEMMEERFEDGDVEASPSSHAYTSTINAWARSRAPNKAVRSLEILRRAEAQYRTGNFDAKPTVFMYTAVLNACAYTRGSRKDVEKAKLLISNVWESMLESEDIRPNAVSYNTVFIAYGNLVDDDKEREKLVAATLKLCLQEGHLTQRIIETLQKVAPGVQKRLASGGSGLANIRRLPKEYSRNVNSRTY